MAEEIGFPTVGAALKTHREAQGLSLPDVAAETRIPRRHLDAIEQSDFAGLPAAPYAVGFVKTYARMLGDPADDYGRAFRAELAANREPRPETRAFEPADPARVPPRWLALLALIVAVVVAVGYALWASGRLGPDTPAARMALATDMAADQPAASPSVPQVTGSSSSGAASPEHAPASGPVSITATAPAWLKISDGDRRLFMGVMQPGDHFDVPSSAAAPVIRTAAAQALKITVGTTVLPPLAPATVLIKDVSLKPADLLAHRAASAPLAGDTGAADRPADATPPATDIPPPPPDA